MSKKKVRDITGQIRLAPARDVALADKLIKMKQEMGKDSDDFWEIVAIIVKEWKKRHPKQWKSHIADVGALSDSRGDEFGSNRKTKKGASMMDIRYLADIPQWIIFVLRRLFNADELPMDKEFFRKFARRFPDFRVAKKV